MGREINGLLKVIFVSVEMLVKKIRTRSEIFERIRNS